VAAGITSVEALADMTPEQLEEIPGIGPKTVEKISLAVNEYFSSLEAAESSALAAEPIGPAEAVAEAGVEAAVGEAESQYEQALDDGQALEAAAIAGVDNAPAADVSEVHVHGETPEPAPEEMTALEEE